MPVHVRLDRPAAQPRYPVRTEVARSHRPRLQNLHPHQHQHRKPRNRSPQHQSQRHRRQNQLLQMTNRHRLKQMQLLIPNPQLRANDVSKLCSIIAGLQDRAKKQARDVSTQLEDPGKLIAALRDQVKTVTSLQKCVTDLREDKDGLTEPKLVELQKTFKELADMTDQNHQDATKKGIRLTPKVHQERKPGAQRTR